MHYWQELDSGTLTVGGEKDGPMLRAEEPEDTIVHTCVFFGSWLGQPCWKVKRLLCRRTYDITISYDKYYRTPRVFLFGYDEVPIACCNFAIFFLRSTGNR